MSAPLSDRRRLARARRVLTAVVIGVALSGCTGQSQPGETPTIPTDAGTVPVPAPDRTTVDDEGGVGAHADLQKPTCAAQAGVWSFTGVVKNAARTPQVYTVEVSVVNPDGWSVVGAKSIEVKAEPGVSVPVKAAAFHRESAAQAVKHQCVTRVVRHQG